jgi:hypothetical protein
MLDGFVVAIRPTSPNAVLGRAGHDRRGELLATATRSDLWAVGCVFDSGSAHVKLVCWTPRRARIEEMA